MRISERFPNAKGRLKFVKTERQKLSLKLRHSTLVHACSMSRPRGNINLPCWAKRSRRPVQADYIVKCGAPRNKIKRDVDVRCTCSKSRKLERDSLRGHESSSPRVRLRGNSQFVSEMGYAKEWYRSRVTGRNNDDMHCCVFYFKKVYINIERYIDIKMISSESFRFWYVLVVSISSCYMLRIDDILIVDAEWINWRFKILNIRWKMTFKIHPYETIYCTRNKYVYNILFFLLIQNCNMETFSF